MKSNSLLYAVILAGGSGTRFWPLSREKEPKQFLKIVGEKSLFQSAILRIQSRIKSTRILIVTNKRHFSLVVRQAAALKVPRENILLEPEAKNTAPAICWAAARIFERDPQAVMAVLPSDHLIAKPRLFLKQLEEAAGLARAGFLVTLGIVPTRPETGYGYLKIKRGNGICRVEQFIEKPGLSLAKKFFKSKKYFWNSGMFIWRCDVILEAFARHLPEVHTMFALPKSRAAFVRDWRKLPAVSIDYGILEHAHHVVTVPASNIGWSDLGSWQSLHEVLKKDGRGNAVLADGLLLECDDSLFLSRDRWVAAIGIKDMIVVDTDDVLLICPRERSQDVKKLVARMKKAKNGQGCY